jgi:release factor H-coupled RctB family protein
MGTIGGGNHFAELQLVERVHRSDAFTALGLHPGRLVTLVHSGSRGLGREILSRHLIECRGVGTDPASDAGRSYLQAHDGALRWAKANRELVTRRFLDALHVEGQLAWDGCHNSITRQPGSRESLWIHRKGAVAAEASPVIIPGSRGSLSYLVQPIGDGESYAWSLAHGAGRKWSRSESRLRARERYRVAELERTRLGGRVICEQRDLLYAEAPMAYKPIEQVITALVEARLIEVIATFRPVLTYKTRAVRR